MTDASKCSSAVEESWSRLLSNTVSQDQRPVLEAICDEDDLEGFEFTALHLAVLRLNSDGMTTAIRKLLKQANATIDDLDAHGRSAVSWAAQRGDFDDLNILLEHGANPNAPEGKKSPLIYAAGNTKSVACVVRLLEFDADANAVDTAGMNALMWSCVNFQSHFGHVAPLVQAAQLEATDINRRTALFHAASTHLEPTKTLLQAHANVNHQDQNGYTALHMAISNNHPEIIYALRDAHANYSSVTSTRQTLLHHAALYATVETLHAMMVCQLRGLDVEALDLEGCTPRDRLALRMPQANTALVSAFECLLDQLQLLSEGASEVVRTSSASTSLSHNWHTASEGNASDAASLCSTENGMNLSDDDDALDAIFDTINDDGS
jgi:ankyrin repeat protein